MKAIPFEPGRLAVSSQGRDKGRWLVIVALQDGEHVLVADGRMRKIEKPKKKRVKHLRITPHRAEDIAQALIKGKPLLNSDLRKAIAAARDLNQSQTQIQVPDPKDQKEECALVKE